MLSSPADLLTKTIDYSEFDYSKISLHIRSLKNWNTYDLARELGTSQPTVSRVETRVHIPRKKLKEKLFDLFTSSLFEDICSKNPVNKPTSKEEYLALKDQNPDLFHKMTTAMEAHLDDPEDAKYFMFIGFWYTMCVQHNRKQLALRMESGEPVPPIVFREENDEDKG